MNLSRTEKTVNQIILVLFAVFAVVPLLGVVLSSITPRQAELGWLQHPDEYRPAQLRCGVESRELQ